MPELDSIKSRYLSLGKDLAHYIFPEDFELYFMALELVDSRGKTIEYFAFPLMPKDISVGQLRIENHTQTFGGVTASTTDIYMPETIRIKGTFGRRLKFINRSVEFFAGINFSKNKDQKREFFSNIKTGYGCIKVMDNIIKNSSMLDSYGKPQSLYLYNLAFGNSYIVRAMGELEYSQSIAENMLWSYSISFKSLMRHESINKISKKSTLELLGLSFVNNTINNSRGLIKQILK